MFFALLLCVLSAGGTEPWRMVEVDAGKEVGTIRSLQGVNGGPLGIVPTAPEVGKQYRDLRIDIVRTHDFFGPADIDARWPSPDAIAKSVRADGSKSIFPRREADPEEESSYNWGPTDRVLGAIVGCGAEVFFRIGRSWSADPSPPADFDKFANIVKHVAMHYNDGWARGFHYKVRYWELWNEPDLSRAWGPGTQPFWSGTPEQFYKLYEKVARTLKAHDPALRVGAPAQAAGGFQGPYREGLIAYCAAHRVPLDFYSWHRYTASTYDPYDLARIGKEVRRVLDAAGFRNAEDIVDEWNMVFVQMRTPAYALSSMENAAFLAAAQTYAQDSPLDRALFYRGDLGATGLFDRDGGYRKTAYAFKAVGATLDTPRRLEATGADTLGFAVLAGRSADGKTVHVLVANYEIPEPYRNRPQGKSASGGLPPRRDIRYQDNRGYRLKVRHLPWGDGRFTVARYRTTATANWSEARTSGAGETLEIGNPLPPPGIELIVIHCLGSA
jgi:xylan 1,4-beta-xylosidase